MWVQYGKEREANRDEQKDDGTDESGVVSSSVGAVWDGERGNQGRAAGRWGGRERRGQQQQQQRGCSRRWGLSLPPPGLKGRRRTSGGGQQMKTGLRHHCLSCPAINSSHRYFHLSLSLSSSFLYLAQSPSSLPYFLPSPTSDSTRGHLKATQAVSVTAGGGTWNERRPRGRGGIEGVPRLSEGKAELGAASGPHHASLLSDEGRCCTATTASSTHRCTGPSPRLYSNVKGRGTSTQTGPCTHLVGQ